MSRKYFNDGDDEDAPRFIPVDKKPIDFIPVGNEDKYIQDTQENWWLNEDWEKMQIKK